MNFNPLSRITKLFHCLVILGASGWIHAQALADAPPAKAKTCAACHGEKGVSTNPLHPHLAGQHSQYLEKQLRAFRAGERKEPMMNAMAKTLSDEDITALANFYAAQSLE